MALLLQLLSCPVHKTNLEKSKMAGKPEAGAFVELRGRPWLVEDAVKGDGDFDSLKLSCIADDA